MRASTAKNHLIHGGMMAKLECDNFPARSIYHSDQTGVVIVSDQQSQRLDQYSFSRLANFPVSFLAICLGMIGFTLTWHRAETILQLPVAISSYLLYVSEALIAVVIVTYLVKLLRYPNIVQFEFNHPIKMNFYPILSKLFLITSIIYLNTNPALSKYLWWIGAAVQFTFTLVVMSAWIRHTRFEVHHINPSWFIPVVGSILVPIAGVKHGPIELSWFFFSIGFFWWLILMTLVIYRLVFHNPVPDKLIPTFFILFAPPVIGFIAVTKLMGGLNIFGNLLYYFAGFLFVLIMCQLPLFFRIKFYLSWWAYSFPLAALAIGTFLMYHETGSPFFHILSWVLFVLLNLVIVMLIVKTVRAMANREICIEEKE
jgi:tellurite resistance protein